MTFDQAVEKVQGIMKDANVNDMDSVAIQIHFTNKDCKGTMYISTKNGQLDVQGYDYKDCDAAIELMYGDLTKILTGRLNAATAIEKGTVTVTGNADALSAISSCAKKPAVKKAAAKKTTAKKAASTEPAAKKATVSAAKPAAAKTTSKTTAKKTTK